jgi:hypothetical protein
MFQKYFIKINLNINSFNYTKNYLKLILESFHGSDYE